MTKLATPPKTRSFLSFGVLIWLFEWATPEENLWNSWHASFRWKLFALFLALSGSSAVSELGSFHKATRLRSLSSIGGYGSQSEIFRVRIVIDRFL